MALKRADIRKILENTETSNDDKAKAIQDEFYKTPLKKLASDHAKAFKDLPSTLKKLAAEAEKMVGKKA